MVLKRKRSSSELCSSPSSGSSTSSSPPRQNAFNFSMIGASNTPSHQSGRTMKRVRNSRPTEQLVHREFHLLLLDMYLSMCVMLILPTERTLGMLYSAQQRPAHVQDMMDDTSMESSNQTSTPTPTPQQSLHRFWHINSTPSSAPSMKDQGAPQATNCDDCGGNICGENDGMDIDGYGGDDSACGACEKQVCFSCSVSNLGERRRCLHCAGRKVWVGGIGWANTGVSV